MFPKDTGSGNWKENKKSESQNNRSQQKKGVMGSKTNLELNTFAHCFS